VIKACRLALSWLIVTSVAITTPATFSRGADYPPVRRVPANTLPTGNPVGQQSLVGFLITGPDFYTSVGLDSHRGASQSAAELQNYLRALQPPATLQGAHARIRVEGQRVFAAEALRTQAGMLALERDLLRSLTLLHQAAPEARIFQLYETARTDALRSQTVPSGQNQAEIIRTTEVAALHRVVISTSQEHRQRAGAIFEEAKTTLGSESTKRLYDRTNGLTRLGNAVNMARGFLSPTAVAEGTGRILGRAGDFRPSRMINKMLHGEPIRIAAIPMGIMAMMFSYSLLKLNGIAGDPSENPSVVEKAFEQHINTLTYASMATFFIGGFYGDKVRPGELFRRMVTANHQLNELRRLQNVNREAILKQQRALLGGMTWAGLRIGLLASVAIGFGGDWLGDCTKLFTTKPIDERPMSQSERLMIEQKCDVGAVEFLKRFGGALVHQAAILFPTLLAISGGQRLLGLQSSANSKYLDPRSGRWGRGFPNGVRPRRFAGLSVIVKKAGPPVLRIVGFVGGFVVFSAVSVLLERLIEAGIYRTTVVRPLTRSRRLLEDELEELRQNNWHLVDLEGVSREDQWALHSEAKEELTARFNAFSEASKNLRDQKVNEVLMVVQNWNDHYGRAVNIYSAAKSFYTDVVEQIEIRRNREQALVPIQLPPETGRSDYNFENFNHLADETLPLFRVSPFFRLNTNFTDEVEPRPLWVTAKDFTELPNKEAGEARYFSSQMTEGRRRSFVDFKDEFTARYEALDENVNISHKRMIDDLLPHLQSEDRAIQVRALYNLSYFLEGDDITRLCGHYLAELDNLESDNPEASTVSIPGICHLQRLAQNFLVEDPFEFQVPFAPGFKMHPNESPNQFFPGVMGAEFIAHYHRRLSRKGDDPLWYHPKLGQFEMANLVRRRLRLNSMTQELLYSMFCGPDPSQAYIDSREGWSKDFYAPKLKMKSEDTNYCDLVLHPTVLANPLTAAIPLPSNPEVEVHGLIELLYHELDDRIATRPAITRLFEVDMAERLVEDLNTGLEDFHTEVIEGMFQEAMTDRSRTWNLRWIGLGGTERVGVLESLFEEFAFYFENILDPMVDSFEFEPVDRDEFFRIEDENGNIFFSAQPDWILDSNLGLEVSDQGPPEPEQQPEPAEAEEGADSDGAEPTVEAVATPDRESVTPRQLYDLIRQRVMDKRIILRQGTELSASEYLVLEYELKAMLIVLRSLFGFGNGLVESPRSPSYNSLPSDHSVFW
jgi:hypothetical protein